MENTVLLIVDMQEGLLKRHPYREEQLLSNITSLAGTARENGIAVIYFRHNDGKGSPLEKGTADWEICKLLYPRENDGVFDKNFNSAFKETGLKAYLDSKMVKNIILTGLQTEYCIDATCKAAFEYGYKIIIPKCGTSTFDIPGLKADKLYKFFEERIWAPCFAGLLHPDDIIGKMKNKDF